MSLLSNLEKRLEKLVEGAFSRSPARVEPMDMARFLRKEMRDGRRGGVDGDVCPNVYLITLSKADNEHITGLGGAVTNELQDYLSAEASTQGWQFVGPVIVLIGEDAELRQGEVDISASMRAEDGSEPAFLGLHTRARELSADKKPSRARQLIEPPAPPLAAPPIPPMPVGAAAAAHVSPDIKPAVDRHSHRSAQASGWVLEDSGPRPRRHSIPQWGVMIGRSRYSEICIDHPEVSRQHAQIELRDDGLFIEDLESTNGTYVNGKKIRSHDLMAGDKITIGPVTLKLLKD